MVYEPQLQTLPKKHRARFFWFLVLVFMLTLPVAIFYTTGYRLTKIDDRTTITPTGGVYLTTTTDRAEVFVDETRVASPRLFRSAYYVQNVPAGQRRIVVQGDGLQTWVKDLPVDPYLVTEAAAFTLPTQPRLRFVHPLVSATGTPHFSANQPPEWFDATIEISTSSLLQVVGPTTTASGMFVNEEFEFIASLFGTSTRTSVLQASALDLPPFRFATATTTSTSTSAVPVERSRSGIVLFERSGELFARWTGGVQRIPYYFCILNTSAAGLELRYGSHVAAQVEVLRYATTSQLLSSSSGRVCRTEIRLDRMNQDVLWFDFMPGQRDVVLLLLVDGLYAVEIDDRSWQNSQKLISGSEFQVIVFGSQIYIKEGDWIAEIILDIES